MLEKPSVPHTLLHLFIGGGEESSLSRVRGSQTEHRNQCLMFICQSPGVRPPRSSARNKVMK